MNHHASKTKQESVLYATIANATLLFGVGRPGLMRQFSLLLGGSLLVLAVVSCTSSDEDSSADTTPISSLMLKNTTDCNSYKNYLANSIFKQLTDYPIYADVLEDSSEGDSTTDGPQPDDVSGTNLQEQGVDEADLVKADSLGNLYIVHGNYLLVEKGFPPTELTELGQLDLGVRADKLYLDETGKRLVILANYPYYTPTLHKYSVNIRQAA